MNWFAAYVKSRHEFHADSELHKKGIDTFLPSIERLSQWKDRKKTIRFPIFPGYLFVYIHPEPKNFLSVVKTRGVVTLVSLEPSCPAAIPDEEMNSLKILVENGNDFDIYPQLNEGARVRIRRGPLKGAEGFLTRKKDKCIFYVNVNLLGRSLGLQIYADDIEEA